MDMLCNEVRYTPSKASLNNEPALISASANQLREQGPSHRLHLPECPEVKAKHRRSEGENISCSFKIHLVVLIHLEKKHKFKDVKH